MELIEKLKWIIEHGIDPRRSEIHAFICYCPIDCDDFSRYWEFHRYETVYYTDLSERILDDLWDEENNKIYDSNRYDLDYIENLVNKMYEDGQKGYWGFEYDW